MSIGRYSLFVFVQFIVLMGLYGQQTPQISHYMFNKQMYNPASVGFTNSIVASAIHRQQWYGMEGAPQTTLVSIDAPLRMINSGVGLNVTNNRIGFFNTTTIQLAYNYQIPFLDGTLGMGIHLGMNNIGLRPNWNPGQPGDHILQGMDDVSDMLFDVGLGFFYSVTDQYEIGISLGHINQPSSGNLAFEKRRVLNLSGNYNFSLDMFPRIDFVPSTLIKTDFTSTQIDLSLIGVLDRQYWGGISYRWGDAIVLLAGLHLQQFPLQIGIAYDIATNWMSRASNIAGGFEIFARYSFNLAVDRIPQSNKNSRFL
ncbi:MAG: PorP/SprF family type IX secretion system membrane protein [Bacteroidales bacterium]|nr:PorP/SprF family type IX secretion system membrane protein [Bacteroidales bacterium]